MADAPGTAKVLGPAGTRTLTADDKLTDSHRLRFVTEVLTLQAGGNISGMGVSRLSPLYQFPVPPIPGPSVPSITGETKLFWFEPEPHALLAAPFVSERGTLYDELIIKGIYEPLMEMLNMSGATPLAIVWDPTIFIDLSKFSNLKKEQLPEILAKLILLATLSEAPQPAVKIAAKLMLFEDYGISDPTLQLVPLILSPPKLPVAIPTIPSIPIPRVPNPGSPQFFLPDLVTGIFELPLKIIPMMLGKIAEALLAFDPVKIVTDIVRVVFDLIIELLKKAGILIAPLSLMAATLIVILKNMISACLALAVGKTLGTGFLVALVGELTGLGGISL